MTGLQLSEQLCHCLVVTRISSYTCMGMDRRGVKEGHGCAVSDVVVDKKVVACTLQMLQP